MTRVKEVSVGTFAHRGASAVIKSVVKCEFEFQLCDSCAIQNFSHNPPFVSVKAANVGLVVRSCGDGELGENGNGSEEEEKCRMKCRGPMAAGLHPQCSL